MNNTLDTIKGLVGGVTYLLLSVLGLLVVAQVVFGEAASINVIGNLQTVVNGFVGEGASLTGIVVLLLIVALLQKGQSGKAS
tara:strand:- start:830 stop:1075 length:246 start_codon:yes stop_codon:yes gene_type:complete